MRNRSHYDALLTKHRALDGRLKEELRRPLPDSFAVQRLKRQKLLVKDELESWEQLTRAVRVQPSKRAVLQRARGDDARSYLGTG